MATQVDLSTIPISPDGGNDPSSSAETAKEEVVTVFHDPNNFNVIHPLAHKWVLWYTRPPTGKGETWSALLKVVFAEIDSVETFWGVYNHLPGMVSELLPKTDYHLFKHKLDDKHKKEHPNEPPKWKPIRPEWEDDANKHGGRWSYTFKNKQGVDIDNAFLHTMLAAIGETLDNDDEDEVTGVVVNVRKGFYRISVWTRTMGKAIPKGSSDGDQAVVKPRSAEQGKAIILGIGKRFKEIIKVPPGEVVEFLSHADAALAGSSRAKARFTV